MKRLLILVLFASGIYYLRSSPTIDETPVAQIPLSAVTTQAVASQSASTQAVAVQAPTPRPASSVTYGRDHSGTQIQGTGSVVRILSDDNDGSRHQRFIIRLPSGQTLLVAHNIDIAPRISGISQNDGIGFNGEYEWNSQGGVMHWTHHDPGGRHQGGWLKHKGRTYQ